MTASILSFVRQKLTSVPLAPKMPWQNQDFAELYRVRDRLAAAGVAVEVDSGVSDEGDPWFIYQQAGTDNIVVHIARIDTEIHVVNCVTGNVYVGTSFREVSDQMLQDAPAVLAGELRRGSNVILHPSAFLTAFVAAAIMLVDLIEHNRAEAAEPRSLDGEAKLHNIHASDRMADSGASVSHLGGRNAEDFASDDGDLGNAHRRLQKDGVGSTSQGGSHPTGPASALALTGHTFSFIDMPSTVLSVSLFAIELLKMIQIDHSETTSDHASSFLLGLSTAEPEGKLADHSSLLIHTSDAIDHTKSVDLGSLDLKAQPTKVALLADGETGISYVDIKHAGDLVFAELSGWMTEQIVHGDRFFTPAAQSVIETLQVASAVDPVSTGSSAPQASDPLPEAASTPDAVSSSPSVASSQPVVLASAPTPPPAPVVKPVVKVIEAALIEQLLTGKKLVVSSDKVAAPADPDLSKSPLPIDQKADVPQVGAEDADRGTTPPKSEADVTKAELAPQEKPNADLVPTHEIRSIVPDFKQGTIDILCYHAGDSLSVKDFILGEDILTFSDLATADTYITRFSQDGGDIVLGDTEHGQLRLIGVLLEPATSAHAAA